MQEYTITEIIDYARVLEENAKKYYLDAEKIVTSSHAKDFLKELASEEEKHIALLKKLQSKVDKKGKVPKVKNIFEPLGYADYVADIELDEKSDYKEILLVGIKKEKEALEIYEKLGNYTDDPDAVKLFSLLANEEKKHLRKFENAYSDLLDSPY